MKKKNLFNELGDVAGFAIVCFIIIGLVFGGLIVFGINWLLK